MSPRARKRARMLVAILALSGVHTAQIQYDGDTIISQSTTILKTMKSLGDNHRATTIHTHLPKRTWAPANNELAAE